MPYDTGLAERVRDTLHRLGERGAREKNVFGGRGFLFGKKTFLVVMDDGLLIKTAPDEYEKAKRQRGVKPFAPDGERAMSTWLVIDFDVVADDPELADWVAAAIRGVRVAQ
jgi:TfoX/Sxy family transcriptional regulator of competence genes